MAPVTCSSKQNPQIELQRERQNTIRGEGKGEMRDSKEESHSRIGQGANENQDEGKENMDNGSETPLTNVGHTKENQHKKKRQAGAGQERGGKHRHVQEIRNKRWGRNRRVRKRTKGKRGHT